MNYYAQPTQIGNGLLYSVGIASGDFNGDGIPDFVVGNAKSGGHVAGFTVFLSNPDGSMQPGVNYAPVTATYELEYVAVGDFNGDGKLDIAVTDALNGGVQIFTGNGDGTFTPGATFATETTGTYTSLGIVVGDFNGDGHPDLAVVDVAGTSADVGILLNDAQGLGNFALKTNLTLSNVSAAEITAADLGNNQTDLLVPLSGADTVAVFLGKGDGTFPNGESDVSLANCVSGGACLQPIEAAVADVNGDGKPDLLVTVDDQTTSQGVVVALGNGDGTFQSTVKLFSVLTAERQFRGARSERSQDC